MKISFLLQTAGACLILFYSGYSQGQLQLRAFSGFANDQNLVLSIVRHDYAVIANQKGVFEWRGDSISPVLPRFPHAGSLIGQVKAFSPRNIWVFFQRSARIYYSRISHFDGTRWRQIHAPQSNTLHTLSFLDSTRFFAAGGWGSVIYYNGQEAINLPSFPFVEINILQAFTSDHFYAHVQLDYRDGNDDSRWLYEYLNGEWKALYPLQITSKFLHFYHPDSGIAISPEGEVLALSRSGPRVIERLTDWAQMVPSAYQGDRFYFHLQDSLYRYRRPGLEALVPLAEDITVMGCLNDREYLLLDSRKQLLYLGGRAVGDSITTGQKQLFKVVRNYGPEMASEHIGLGLYHNSRQQVDLYLTRPENKNEFFTSADSQSGKIDLNHDVQAERGLIGVSRSENATSWDGTTYFADLDNDGDMDALAAALLGKSLLYENTGNDNFQDITERHGFHLQGRIGVIYFRDLNGDGLLDLLAGDELKTLHVLLNQGFLRFRDVSQALQIPHIAEGALPAFADLDNDGDEDMLLYTLYKPLIYLENRGRSGPDSLPVFIDRSAGSPELTGRFDFLTQSIAFGDYDNDGDTDIFLANRVTPCKLFENDGRGHFRDVSRKKGIGGSNLTYGANWGDLDQDGDLDLFVSNLGINYIYWNQSGDLFEKDSLSLAMNDYSYTRASALADLDADGDLDIITANGAVSFSRIYRNPLNQSNFLKIWTEGAASNRSGIGSKIWLYRAGHIGDSAHLLGFRTIRIETGYMAGSLPLAHFGVPPETRCDIRVKFPSGREETLLAAAPGRSYIIQETQPPGLFLNRLAYFGKSLLYIPARKEFTLRLLILLVIMGGFYLFIHWRVFWPAAQSAVFFGAVFSIYFFVTLFFYGKLSLWDLAIPAYLTMLGGGVAWGVVNRIGQSNAPPNRQQELFDLLRQFHHSQSGLKYLNHLLFYCNNMSDARLIESFRSDFHKSIDYFQHNTLPLLRQLYFGYLELPKYRLNARQIRKRFNRLPPLLERLSHQAPTAQHLLKLQTILERFKQEIRMIRFQIERLNTHDLNGLVQNVVAQFPQFTEVTISKAAGEERLPVIIREADFSQAFSNLLQNALEAMQHLQNKSIHLTFERREEGRICLKVQDRGPGISPAHAALIFEESFSTKNSSGLGLFHARNLLRRYRGDLWLDSPGTKNSGATFCMMLKEFRHDAAENRDD